jgi:hypothetical protein
VSASPVLKRLRAYRDRQVANEPERAGQITDEHLRQQAALAERLREQLCGSVAAPAIVLASPTGTGKTLIALVAAIQAVDGERYDRIAVLAPNAHVRGRWRAHAAALVDDADAIEITERSTAPRAGELVTYTVQTIPQRRFPDGTLVVLDEAHRGTQNRQSKSYRRLEQACSDRAVLLVTATPYQLSTSGLISMLTVNGSQEREQELEPVRKLAGRLRPLLTGQATGPSPSDPELQKLRSAVRESREVIDHHLVRPTRWDAEGVYQPSDASIEMVPLDAEWATAYWSARALAALTDRGVTDTVNRGLDSASETFLRSRLAERVRERADGRSDLLDALEGALGRGVDHPKVRRTVDWVRERVADGRHVLLFSYFINTQQAVAEALIDELGDGYVQAPIGSSIAPLVVERFRNPDAEPLVLAVTDRFSESIDLDGGRPCVVHHDLHWNPNRLRQRMGRVTRLSSGYQPVDAADAFMPVLETPTDQRMCETVFKRFSLGDLLVPAEYEFALERLPAEIAETIREALSIADDSASGS